MTSVKGYVKQSLRQLSRRIAALKFVGKPIATYTCPICAYSGPFLHDPVDAPVQCVKCGSLPRHRLIILTLDAVFTDKKWRDAHLLYVAPEVFFTHHLEKRVGEINAVPIRHAIVESSKERFLLKHPDASFDIVCASHVLEDIVDDRSALSEIRRVLNPGGAAILPVPVVCEKTVEYGAVNEFDSGHARAPGWDYFERYEVHFKRVEVHRSEDFDPQYQLYAYEDRSQFPTAKVPLRPAMSGIKHAGACPICWV